MLKIKFTIVAALFSKASIFAQAHEKMSCQAVVRNSENAIVANQTLGMQISVLHVSTPYFAQDLMEVCL